MQESACDLTSCFLCSFCIPEWKEAIAIRKKTLTIKRGKPVFREGEQVKGIFFLYSGSVKVHMRWVDQKDLILRFARTGDILGHRGLGAGNTYPITATAMEDTAVCFIPNEFLEASLKTNPHLTYRLLHFYAEELRKAEKRMRDLVHMETKGRVAEALLYIAGFFGLTKDKYLDVTITRHDIASYAGTTYETVFKFFTELSAAKIISTEGKRIQINHPDQLKKYITVLPS